MPKQSSNAMKYLDKLVVEIGPRLIGSPANQTAADYVRDTFAAAGLQVEEQPYPCTAWEHRGTLFEADGKPIPARANAFSPSCDVRGEIVPLCTTAELQAASLEGRIALFYGELANTQIAPRSWFLRGERDELLYSRMEQKRPLAVLAPPMGSPDYEQLTEDWDLPLPAATLPRETVLELLTNPPRQARLRIDTASTPATARNIVARKSSSLSQKVVICAHFDTFDGTPGATDNGTGAAALLAIAGDLAVTELPFTLEFVAFNGEEALPMGDDEYLRLGGEDLGNILLAINMDDMGAASASNSIAIFSASDNLHKYVDSLVKEYPGVVWVEPWPESNHSTFAMRGVPSLAFGSVGVRHLAHTPQDSIEQASTEKIAEVIDLIEDIVRGLAGKSPDWSRTKE
jgi:aminopeptidase YwaD